MSNLSSKKLVAAVVTILAMTLLVGYAIYSGTPVDQLDKPLIAISGVGLSAIGAQAVIDGSKPKA